MHPIVAEARTWIGTKFHHQGRVKGVGVDCIGLIVGVAENCGITFGGRKPSMLDERNYGMLPEGERLKTLCEQHLVPKEKHDAAPGDVALFAFEKLPQHVAIIGELADGSLSLIHSYRQARGVVEHRLDDLWWKRCIGIYQFPNT